jgi:6-phosphofructokinase 2
VTQILTVTPNPALDLSTSTERIVPFSKLRCASARHDPGGGGINVARVVRRLGGEVLAVFPVGGVSGGLLSRLLASEDVSTLEIAAREETRQNITVFERTTGMQFRFVLPGAALDELEWRHCLDAIRRPTPPAMIVASGSLPPGVPDDFYGQVVRLARSMNARAVVDASGPALKAALAEGPFLIKPNLREFQELVGEAVADEEAWIRAGRSLIARGRAELIALTLGHRGALLIARDAAWHAEGPPLTVASVVGAGDSFTGAMAWSLCAGHGLERALRYGVAAGSSAVLNPGTELCRLADIERLAPDVVMRQV